MSKTDREWLTAISIDRGIITLIEPTGSIGMYRQRGIGSLNEKIIANEIANNKLNPLWTMIKELPKNWSIEFEDTEIMGRALATYPEVLRISYENRAKNMNKIVSNNKANGKATINRKKAEAARKKSNK